MPGADMGWMSDHPIESRPSQHEHPTARCLKCRAVIELDAATCFYCKQSFDGIVLEPVQATGGSSAPPVDTSVSDLSQTGKTCPSCAEQIKNQAIRCRFCAHDFAGAPRGIGRLLRPKILVGVVWLCWPRWA